MEKYIIVLIILAMMFFIFCTFPVLGKEPTNSYIITTSSFLGDKLYSSSGKWQTNSYFVYKTDSENIIPKGKAVQEYYLPESNNIILSTPYLKAVKTSSGYICGAPYIID